MVTKAGINRNIAVDLSCRYYKNELTYKDIKYLENTFNLKPEMLERSLNLRLYLLELNLIIKLILLRIT
ncbi:Bdr family repetitive protein [Borrelia hermsii]|uniref:Bdr family repetitive protein n=1 Tax=Borrelia hermsii TaxID=140 RepID=UPI0022031B1A|nr:BDR-repeat family protein [Borrelia hermsii]